MMKKNPIQYSIPEPTVVRVKEEKIGRIVSAKSNKQLTQRIRPRICRASQIKMVTKPIRMAAKPIRVNVSGCRAAKKETPPTLKVEFQEKSRYHAQLEYAKDKSVMGGVHYVGKQVTLTGFHQPILLTPTHLA